MTSTASSLRRIETRAELREQLDRTRNSGARIGFVPTMGALHEGHLSLIDVVRAHSDLVAVSIFVNPLQFGPHEDFNRYPRDLEADAAMLADRGAEILFAPATVEMYPKEHSVRVSPGPMANEFEGRIRPGHFEGVLTIVAKLFNIVQPHVVAFGQKDLQQAALVRSMIRDLDFDIEMIVAPIVRESDGLALSSRNRYLSEPERKEALLLSRSLAATRNKFDKGESSAANLEAAGLSLFDDAKIARLDYFSVIDAETFAPVQTAAKGSAIVIAARLGKTRLIDNIIL